MTDATNAEQLVITLADDVVAPIAADQKVYVTYSGSDLDDAAGNQVTQFTKVVDVSGSSTANAATDGITGATVDANGKVITPTFDEDLNATDPALANFTVTIGDQSYSGATFIASTVTDATNAEQLVITLADDVVAPIAADQKVYVTYSGSDLDDAAGNQVTQFTKVVDVSGSNTANAATDGITGATVDANGKVITLTFDEDLNATDPALANFTVTIGDQSYSGATWSPAR